MVVFVNTIFNGPTPTAPGHRMILDEFNAPVKQFADPSIMVYTFFMLVIANILRKNYAMNELVRLFKALGDETRLRLVSLLVQQEPGRAMCVGRLARELEVSSSAVSQHLRILKDLGLVQGVRRGYRLHYFLDKDRLAEYHELIRLYLGESFVFQGKENASPEIASAPSATKETSID